MKEKTKLCLLFCAAAVSVFLLCGCESESTDKRIKIYPDSADISEGESVEFTVTGGYEYTWSLEEDGGGTVWGVLSSRHGDSTVYTSVNTPSSNMVTRVLTVKSTPYQGSESNSAPDSWTAKAYIVHH
ncbi:MAG: hypothetical protein R6V03_07120 [Kiritimatiellia bacterium]